MVSVIANLSSKQLFIQGGPMTVSMELEIHPLSGQLPDLSRIHHLQDPFGGDFPVVDTKSAGQIRGNLVLLISA